MVRLRPSRKAPVGGGATIAVQTNVSFDLGAAVKELIAAIGAEPSAAALQSLEAIADGD